MVKKFFSPELAQAAGLAMDRFPATQEEVAKAEQVLADELQKLTLQEHEQILFSVHGLPRCTLEDDSVAMEARLNDLEMELDKINTKDREVYDECGLGILRTSKALPFDFSFSDPSRMMPRPPQTRL